MNELKGFELREAVAVKIMGHKIDLQAKWNEGRLIDKDGCKIPAYERGISAAWLVIQKLRDQGWHWSVSKSCSGVLCGFVSKKWKIANAYAEAAPEAICLAALKTLENNNEPT